MKIILKSTVRDMALSRSDAMDRCISLGRMFIIHFDKIYKKPSDVNVNHWSKEMQTWLDKVNSIVLKNTNKPPLNQQLRDWFFTAGSNPENIVNMDNNESESYDKFVDACIINRNVKNSLRKVYIIK